jgi:UDP-2,4-diacetamido-2,4,6-trideoxy-beta-L-altropyranose hydrolase
MNILFRVDASIAIGTGHVMRCRTLASTLKKHGADIQFIIRALPGHLEGMLTHDGFSVTLLPPPSPAGIEGNDYAAWLGVSQQEDAEQTIHLLKNQKFDWLIVDHYGLDRVWETHLRPYARKLMVIDDLANRPHECDVLLDQNYAVDGDDRYRTWVPERCELLQGPRYALLRPEYAQYRKTMAPRTGDIKRLFVFIGGADNANITGKVLAALSAAALIHLEADVVIGSSFIHKDEVTRQASARPNIHIHGPRPHLADLMAKADLAVGAGGGTTWERLCMGLPSLVMSIAENQVPACEALACSGLIRYLGDAHKLDATAIESALLEALAVPDQLHALANGNQALLVDGRGADRVAEALTPTPATSLTLRPTNAHDALTYFSWVNDPAVRASAIHSEPIDMASHLKWFDRRLSDENTHLYVLEAGDLPVGQVRFERQGTEAAIDYSLDALVRGRGWSTQLLKLGIETLNTSQLIVVNAYVKSKNIASVATLVHLGFVEQLAYGDGNRHFKLPLPRFSLLAQRLDSRDDRILREKNVNEELPADFIQESTSQKITFDAMKGTG